MPNVNRFLVGRVAVVIWASGFILVLSACGGGFGAVSPPLAAWERVLVEQKECEARAALQRETYEKLLAEKLAKPIPQHQTDAEVKAMGMEAEAWAKDHAQMRAESLDTLRCLRNAANQMEALNAAEEWMASRGGYGPNYGVVGFEPFPVLPVQPPGSITLPPDIKAGVYWVPGLPTERVFVPGQAGHSITLTPDYTNAGYYWVPGSPTERVFVPGQGGYLPPSPRDQPWPPPKPSFYP